ncbi:acyltransferase [Arthrobacter sp. NicSoilC5]|uniref:acyltransferase family protein n=1 Tax=Arthrobacter sp. NicSoilC5 TaxID=2831000 RepID=UPI001CC5A988|nr:acyltransferase [Arthrobacter sp. NicSoilC5]
MGESLLGQRFAEGKNSLNAIRLVLAALVIVSHSWWLGAYGPEPAPGGVKLGSWAVLGFFGISGYLITRSRMRLAGGDYWRARFLRIFPGLVTCVAAVAFVIAPLTAVLSGRRYWFPDAVLYFASNLSAGFPGVAVGGIPGSLDGLPDPRLWNGPLWTLFWEIFCYVLVGLLFLAFRAELARIAVLCLSIAGTVAVFFVDAGWVASPTRYDWPLVPVLTFLAGSLVFLYQDRIPVGRRAVVLYAVLVLLIASVGYAQSLVHLPLAIFLVAVSLHLPLSTVGSRFDISYGVYIYGWPVQQVLASTGLHTAVPPELFAAASLMLVAPLAWMSCRYVEIPARGWFRRWKDPRRAPQLA